MAEMIVGGEFCRAMMHQQDDATRRGKSSKFFVNGKGLLLLSGDGQSDQVVVPKLLVDDVLRHMHKDMISGHQEMSRASSKVAAMSFWPSWREDV
jgi:hypothetical protein